MIVFFEETGEERVVVGQCKRCEASSTLFHGEVFGDAMIVSPSGLLHTAAWESCETTACGIDATGDLWWHQL